ncbi:helix-turn-helix domain-containing protein [Mycobacterium sp. NPDC048908]|uniref:helix-turn-helix domain-containing protein n=1 Tax=Mycobacterium sp. NPDC048908 TaxID=3364292 RepID=UPI0037188E37
MPDSWLSLLLAGASVAAIDRHRDDLIRGGADPNDAHRQAGEAIQLLTLLDERRRRAAELTAVNDIAVHLTSTHAVDDVLRQITMQARRLLGVDLAYVGVVRGEDFVFEVASGALTAKLEGLRVPRRTGMVSLVLASGEPIWTSDYFNETSFVHDQFDALARAEQFRALLGVPLTMSGRVIGVLFVCKRAERHFRDDEIALLAALASHAAVAIDNAATIEQQRRTADELRTANRQLQRSLAWDHRLSDIVLRGGGVEDLVAEIAAAASGRVLLLDAYANLPEDLSPRSPGLARALATAQANPEAAESVSSFDSGSTKFAWIVANREPLGALILVDGDDDAGDHLLLERAAPALALAMLEERAVADATRLTREAMLVDLMTRPAEESAALRQRMRAAGLDTAERYCVVAAQPRTLFSRTWRAQAAALMPVGTIAAADGTRLLAVVPTDRPDILARELTAAASHLMTAGIAGPADGAADLHECYRRAVDTMNALLRLERAGAISTADELGIYRILLQHTGRQELQAQFNRELGAVVTEQGRRDMPMLATLRGYLDHGCRAAPAARALGIHVNTLYQRIAALDRLLGEDWRKPPRSLDLHILVRIVPDQG